MSINQTISTITPAMATDILRNNKVNRRLSSERVNQYAHDLRNGKWQLNGEAIKFYDDGSLADGQHRLSAIVKSETPMVTSVVTGLPKTVTIQDRGRTRSVTDSMLLEGMTRSLANPSIVAVAKLHFAVQQSKTLVSDGMVKDFISKNSTLLLDLIKVSPPRPRKAKALNVRSAPVLLACFYAINSTECGIDQIKEFLDVLHSGFPKSLTQTAAIVCRNDLLSNEIDINGNTTRRVKAVMQVEKAIYDFVTHYERKVSYSNWSKPIYSNHANNKEE